MPDLRPAVNGAETSSDQSDLRPAEPDDEGAGKENGAGEREQQSAVILHDDAGLREVAADPTLRFRPESGEDGDRLFGRGELEEESLE